MGRAEANEQGGVDGRKVVFKSEGPGYGPKRAVLAAQKLASQNKIFMVIGPTGTAQDMAAMPVQFSKNAINFFPVTAAREMYGPFHRLKYAHAAPYHGQIRMVLPTLVKKNSGRFALFTRTTDSGWKCCAVARRH